MSLGNSITIKSKEDLEHFVENAQKSLEEKGEIHLKVEVGVRSPTQNRSLHLYCGQVAKALNDAGYDVNTFFKEGFTVPFSKYIVKDNLWRPLQEAVTGEESTTKPTKKQYTEIYEHLNSKLAEKGIHIPWPSNESLMNSQR